MTSSIAVPPGARSPEIVPISPPCGPRHAPPLQRHPLSRPRAASHLFATARGAPVARLSDTCQTHHSRTHSAELVDLHNWLASTRYNGVDYSGCRETTRRRTPVKLVRPASNLCHRTSFDRPTLYNYRVGLSLLLAWVRPSKQAQQTPS